MKNLICLCILIICYYFSNAQETESISNFNKVIGGSFSINYEQEDGDIFFSSFFSTVNVADTRLFGISINPYFGIRINQGFLIAIQPSYSYFETEYYESGTGNSELIASNTSQSVGIGLFFRDNLKTIGRFKIFIQPSLGAEIQMEETQEGSFPVVEINTFSLSALASVGVSYSVTERFNLLVNFWRIGYEFSNTYSTIETTRLDSHSFVTDFSLSNITFGAEYSF